MINSAGSDFFHPGTFLLRNTRWVFAVMLLRILPVPAVENEPANADTAPATLSLTAAVNRMLTQNLDLEVARIEIITREAEVARERGRFVPETFAGTEFGDETTSETARATGERFDVKAETRESEIGLRSRWATGTETRLRLVEAEDDSNRAPGQQELRAELQVIQPLLRDRGEDIGLLSVQQAEIGVEISREELRGYVSAMIARTEKLYWETRLAEEGLELTQKGLEIADTHLEGIRQRIAAGQIARNQLAAAEAERAQRRQNVIDALALRDSQRLRLRRVLFWDELSPLPPLVSHPPPAGEAIEDADPWTHSARQWNAELREARLRLTQGRLEVVRGLDGLRPRLDFFVELAKTGFGEDMSSARENFIDDADSGFWRGGIRFVREWGNGPAEADLRMAEASEARAELAVRNLTFDIQSRIQLAVREYNRALEQRQAGADTRRLREATAQAEEERFALGASNSLLVAQTQREALESQLAELRSRLALENARIGLEEISGMLLRRYGVEVEQRD